MSPVLLSSPHDADGGGAEAVAGAAASSSERVPAVLTGGSSFSPLLLSRPLSLVSSKPAAGARPQIRRCSGLRRRRSATRSATVAQVLGCVGIRRGCSGGDPGGGREVVPLSRPSEPFVACQGASAAGVARGWVAFSCPGAVLLPVAPVCWLPTLACDTSTSSPTFSSSLHSAPAAHSHASVNAAGTNVQHVASPADDKESYYLRKRRDIQVT
ncbi:unnamed protein product [Urochloa humidicola]